MNESNERWLPVPGYEGLYEVSNHGRVWSAPRPRARGGIRKPIRLNGGHLNVDLSANGVVEHCLVHCLVMEAFVAHAPRGRKSGT